MRFLSKLLLGACLAVPSAAAQNPAVGTFVAPPSDDVLDAVNLKTEWTTAVPLVGRQDGVALIQVADGNQVFVQTKSGVLFALDSKTGALQWSTKMAAEYVPALPVAVNDRYVVATNLVTMYCFHRYTGLQEFEHKLPLIPTAGPAIDLDTVYAVLNGQRVTAFALPDVIKMPDRLSKPVVIEAGSMASAAGLKAKNPADVVSGRYPSTSRNTPLAQPRFDEPKVSVAPGAGAVASTSQRSPSLSILPTVRPPYRTFDDRGKYISNSESLSTVHTLRQPYSLQDPTGAHVQRTPSINSIPPSVAASIELSSLLPRGLTLQRRWVVGSTVRLTYTPLTTNFRVWMTGESATIQAVLKEDKALQLTARLPNVPAAQPVQAEDVGYIPLIDGNLMAIDLTSGGGGAFRLNWRANVGGAMNRKPLVTKDSLYQGGDTSGVARVDRATGEVTWRTDETADRVLAVNDEAVYVRDKQGLLRVYDKFRVEDPTTKRAVQLGTANLSGFTVPAMNEKTDRLFLATDTGLLICLRDKAAKYTAALTVAPPEHKINPALLKKAEPNPMTPAEPAPAAGAAAPLPGGGAGNPK